MSSRTLRLSFPARTEYLLLPRLALTGVARSCAMSEETLADLRLAVTEACGNAVRHAYDDGHGSVRVEIEFDARTVRVSVEDDGGGLDVKNALPGRYDDLVANADEGGMGLSIIRAIADEVEIGTATGADRGTRVVFTKALG
jgi:serine/threonine-protein kinase RsbW